MRSIYFVGFQLIHIIIIIYIFQFLFTRHLTLKKKEVRLDKGLDFRQNIVVQMRLDRKGTESPALTQVEVYR
jgi:uncharacterized SAM-binding protein YcdF (DUF218 family)